jgi:hypothetical protein
MASNVYTGQVQGLSKIATGTPSAFCRVVTGGKFAVDLINVVTKGLGGQLKVRKSLYIGKLNFQCVGPAKADTQLWFPTTAGVQVAAFPDFLVEADDGSNGQEFQLAGGQPASVTVSLGESNTEELMYDFTAWFVTVTQQARGTDVPVYNSVGGHTRNDITVAWAGSKYGCMSFSLTNDLGIQVHNPADGKTALSKTKAEGVYYTGQDIRFEAVTSNVHQIGAAAILGDEWTPGDITITCANATVGENILFTLGSFVPDGEASMPLEVAGKVGFGQAYVPGGNGTIWNRVVLT